MEKKHKAGDREAGEPSFPRRDGGEPAGAGGSAGGKGRVSPGHPASVMGTDQTPNKLSLHRKAFC